MRCPHCQSTATAERRERTELGYRRWLWCNSQTEDDCVHTDVSLRQPALPPRSVARVIDGSRVPRRQIGLS